MLDLLDEALDRQILRERRDQSGTYEFNHALIRQTLYSELSTPRRVRMHRQILGALEGLLRAQHRRAPHRARVSRVPGRTGRRRRQGGRLRDARRRSSGERRPRTRRRPARTTSRSRPSSSTRRPTNGAAPSCCSSSATPTTRRRVRRRAGRAGDGRRDRPTPRRARADRARRVHDAACGGSGQAPIVS